MIMKFLLFIREVPANVTVVCYQKGRWQHGHLRTNITILSTAHADLKTMTGVTDYIPCAGFLLLNNKRGAMLNTIPFGRKMSL